MRDHHLLAVLRCADGGRDAKTPEAQLDVSYASTYHPQFRSFGHLEPFERATFCVAGLRSQVLRILRLALALLASQAEVIESRVTLLRHQVLHVVLRRVS